MSLFHRFIVPALATLLLAAALPAAAGQSCVEQPARPEDAAKSRALAELLRAELERGDNSLVFVARAGVDLSEFGLHHSHVGVAWRDHPSGRWFTFHLLNRCGTGQSELVEQSLEDFYNVELYDFEALAAVPSFAAQVKLQRSFFGPLAKRLHEREYNMIAHPFSTMYQNSNQWVLELTAAALAPEGKVLSRSSAQDWLRRSGFAPSHIPIGAGRRAGARLFSPHVRFSDHTDEEWQQARYAVVSVDSVIAYLKGQDPGMSLSRVRSAPPPLPKAPDQANAR